MHQNLTQPLVEKETSDCWDLPGMVSRLHYHMVLYAHIL